MQQPKRFQAATLADAYAMVREELGLDAVILSTRKALSPALHGRPSRQFVEVVAHVPEPLTMPGPGVRPDLEQDMAAHDLVRGIAEAAATGALGAEFELEADASAAPPFENANAGTMQPPPTRGRRAPRKPANPRASSGKAAGSAGKAVASAASGAEGPFSALNQAVDATPSEMATVLPAAEPPLRAPMGTGTIADRALVSLLARQLTEVRALLDQIVVDRVADRVDAGPPPSATSMTSWCARGSRPRCSRR